MTNDTPLEAAVTVASGAGRTLAPASVAPNTTAASTAARASMPRGVRLNVWGLSHQRRGRRGSRRTSAMTRASSAESRWTGRLSSAATRVTSSSSCSSTLDLREEGTQRLAGPLDPHLQRRYALTRHLRHLLVTQVLHVLQEERFPLIGRQAVQRPPNRLPPGLVLGGMLHVGLRQRRLVGHHHPLAPGSLAANGAAAVDQDLEHPGAEPLRRGAPFQGPVRPDERFLHGVLGVGLVAQAVQGIAAQAVAVAGDQTSVALDVPAEHPPDQGGVALALCIGMTH